MRLKQIVKSSVEQNYLSLFRKMTVSFGLKNHHKAIITEPVK